MYVVPVALLVVAGIIVTAILVIASKYMAVPVDEKQELIREALPGANCGACGLAGCDEYAAAVARGEAAPNLCIPGGAASGEKIAEIMGLSFENVEVKKAFVKCNGTCDKVEKKLDYDGIETCEACNMLFSGNSSCDYGCLGFGDCVKACAFDAIEIVNGVAVIDREKCTGCEACTIACPKHIIEMLPDKNKVRVACSSKASPKVSMQSCQVSCIACKKCEKACPFDSVHVNDFLAKVNAETCKNCGKCMKECPRGCIIKVS
ncbi:MAG: RnfABCDGE type electron transport complex subunit B [Clostridia bacterium]|nr:RnfABCDGE type electron transport complex subunit B [Clostridia bacterium]